MLVFLEQARSCHMLVFSLTFAFYVAISVDMHQLQTLVQTVVDALMDPTAAAGGDECVLSFLCKLQPRTHFGPPEGCSGFAGCVVLWAAVTQAERTCSRLLIFLNVLLYIHSCAAVLKNFHEAQEAMVRRYKSFSVTRPDEVADHYTGIALCEVCETTCTNNAASFLQHYLSVAVASLLYKHLAASWSFRYEAKLATNTWFCVSTWLTHIMMGP